MAFVQLSFAAPGHVDPSDRQSVDPSRNVHVLRPCFGDCHIGEVDAARLGTTEVSLNELIVTKVLHGACISHPNAAFSLDEQWSRIVDELEEARSAVTASLLIDTELAHVLQNQFGEQCETQETIGDRVQLAISAPSAQIIAEQLAGWDGRIDVTGPDSIRSALAKIGRQLTQRHATP